MCKKTRKIEKIWEIIIRIGVIVAILAGIATIYGVFKPIKIANIEEINALVEESNKTLMLIQEKEEKASSEIKAIDSITLSPEVIQIHYDIEALTTSYEFINKNINHINEISSKKYLKSLSKYELLMLTLDDMTTTRKINDMVVSDLQQIIIPYVNDEVFDHEILTKHYVEVYGHALTLLSKVYDWNSEMENINRKLSKYDVSSNTSIKKPGCRLFRICQTSIASKKKIEYFDDWSKFLQLFIDYLSEFQEYYIQNQSNKKLN